MSLELARMRRFLALLNGTVRSQQSHRRKAISEALTKNPPALRALRLNAALDPRPDVYGHVVALRNVKLRAR